MQNTRDQQRVARRRMVDHEDRSGKKMVMLRKLRHKASEHRYRFDGYCELYQYL